MRRLSSFGLVMVLLIVLALALSSSLARAHHLQAVLGTGFTSQGRLTDGGAPANGTYDFEFKLYDDPTGGAQIGPTLTKDDVTVSDGLFTVMLDFGAVSGDRRPSGQRHWRLYHADAAPAAHRCALRRLLPARPWSGRRRRNRRNDDKVTPCAPVERAERRPGRLCRWRRRRHAVRADLRRRRIAQGERLGLDLRCR